VRQEATIPRVTAMETKVKEVINACGVSTQCLPIPPSESCNLPTGNW